MQQVLDLIDAGQIEAAERRIREVHSQNGFSGHDFQLVWQAIWEAKAPGYRGRRSVDRLEQTVEAATRRQRELGEQERAAGV